MLNHTRRVYKYLTQLITKKQREQEIKGSLNGHKISIPFLP